MPSSLYVSFFEEEDCSSASVSEALKANRKKDPVVRQGISTPESFDADEKWFKFEVVKTDEKEFALVWIKNPEYYEMPSYFSFKSKKVLNRSWYAFETEEKFEAFRQALFPELLRKHEVFSTQKKLVEFNSAGSNTRASVWTTWSDISGFVRKMFVADEPFKLVCDNVLVIQSLFPPSEPNFHAFEICIWSSENDQTGIVQVEDDIDLTNRELLSENDEAIYRHLKD